MAAGEAAIIAAIGSLIGLGLAAAAASQKLVPLKVRARKRGKDRGTSDR